MCKSLPFYSVATTLAIFFTTSLSADIVSTSFSGSATAQFKTIVDSVTSTLSSDSLLRNVAADNSFTETTLDWVWDGTTLTGSSLLTAAKTVSAKPGGDHLSSSDFLFSFAIDSQMALTFGGEWGFTQVQGTGDLLYLELTGPSGTIVTDISTGTTGIASDAFFYTGSLDPGSYTLSFSGDLVKTINNALTTRGGWNISQFTLVNTNPVPEPSFFGILALVMAFVIANTRRRSFRSVV